MLEDGGRNRGEIERWWKKERKGMDALGDERRERERERGGEGPTSFVFITGRSWMTLAK